VTASEVVALEAVARVVVVQEVLKVAALVVVDLAVVALDLLVSDFVALKVALDVAALDVVALKLVRKQVTSKLGLKSAYRILRMPADNQYRSNLRCCRNNHAASSTVQYHIARLKCRIVRHGQHRTLLG
jgi:hypothetical protein